MTSDDHVQHDSAAGNGDQQFEEEALREQVISDGSQTLSNWVELVYNFTL